MQQLWWAKELVEHWSLTPEQLALLSGKADGGKLGFAVQLVFYKRHVRFPDDETDVAPAVTAHIAGQIGVAPTMLNGYDWTSRTSRRHRQQIWISWLLHRSARRPSAAEAAKARTAALTVQAEATATQERVDAERWRTPVTQGAAPHSRQEHDDLALNTAQRALEAARFAHHVAEHGVELARAALIADDVAREGVAAWQVLSPVGGRVLRVLQESEAPVALSAPLLEIGDPTDIEVVADFLTTDAVRIHPGDGAWIEDWGGDNPLPGKVRLVEPGGFTKVSALGVDEQRTNVVIDFVAPPAARPTLADGYRVDARVVVATLNDAVVVPAGALFRAKDGWAVFAVVDGVARRRRVGRRSTGGG